MVQSLYEMVAELLRSNPKKYLTAREIAEWIIDNKKDYCTNKMNKTSKKTEKALLTQIIAEIPSWPQRLAKLNVYRTADRPQKYYFDPKTTDIETSECKIHKNKQEEKELYLKLAQYCKSIGVQTLRIDEKTSKKDGGKNYNKWLHADVVGYKDLAAKFNEETKECLIQYSSERSYLYSFEVKDGIITTSNIRENFFQTVSNSSWANYSYLVAEGIEDKVKEELQLLCSSFKIGFIQLDRENPLESDIVIQAPKTDLDWNMINRISDENSDFRKYLKNISLSYKKHSNNDIQSPKWDI